MKVSKCSFHKMLSMCFFPTHSSVQQEQAEVQQFEQTISYAAAICADLGLD